MTSFKKNWSVQSAFCGRLRMQFEFLILINSGNTLTSLCCTVGFVFWTSGRWRTALWMFVRNNQGTNSCSRSTSPFPPFDITTHQNFKSSTKFLLYQHLFCKYRTCTLIQQTSFSKNNETWKLHHVKPKITSMCCLAEASTEASMLTSV